MRRKFTLRQLGTACAAVCCAALASPAHGQVPLTQGMIGRAASHEVARLLGVDPAGARRQAASRAAWSEAITALSSGAALRVWLDDGSKLHGAFRAADDHTLTLSVTGIDRSPGRAEILRIDLATGTHRKRHMNIGMAIGAAAAAYGLERHCRGRSTACYEEAMLFYMPLMAAGGAAGHYAPAGTAWRSIYDRR